MCLEAPRKHPWALLEMEVALSENGDGRLDATVRKACNFDGGSGQSPWQNFLYKHRGPSPTQADHHREILTDVPGKESGSLADRLANSFREVLDPMGMQVTRPVKCAELRVAGLEDSVTLGGVAEALA